MRLLLCAECLNKHLEVGNGVGLSDKNHDSEIKVKRSDKHYEERIGVKVYKIVFG